MKEKALALAPEYYLGYISLVGEGKFLSLLENGGIDRYEQHIGQLINLGDKTYATGKWTVKQLLQHCIDTERIFINRALRFVRMDSTNLPGYEQDDYALSARVSHRTVEDLMKEYKALRQSTVCFYTHLSKEELLRTGVANGVEISVLSIGYMLIGHPTHHFNVLEERYFHL